MSIIPSIYVDWHLSPRVVNVPFPLTTISIQDLYDTLRSLEDETQFSQYNQVISAGGKELLLDGITRVGITATLINAVISFGNRPSPVVCSITGGNLVAIDSIGNNITPFIPSVNVSVGLVNSSSATISDLQLQEQSKYITESLRRSHSAFGSVFFWDPVNGNDLDDGLLPTTGRKTFSSIHDDLIVSGRGDCVYVVRTSGSIIVTERIDITKDNVSLRGPGRNVVLSPIDDSGPTVNINGADGVEVDSLRIVAGQGATPTDAIHIHDSTACKISNIWIDNTGLSVNPNIGLHIQGGQAHEIEGITVRGYLKGIKMDGVRNIEARNNRAYQNSVGLELRSTYGTCDYNTLEGNFAAGNTLDLDVGVGCLFTIVGYLNLAENAAALIDNGTATIVGRFASETRTALRTWTFDKNSVYMGPAVPNGIGKHVKDNLDATVSSRATVGGVWDAPTSSHQGSGTTGEALTSSNAAEIADFVLREVIADHSGYAGSMAEALTIIKGLSQSNFTLDQTSYNSEGLLTAGRMRIFSNSAQTQSSTDGGTGEGELAVFQVQTETVPGSPALAKVYKVSKVG